ncbi:GSCFA domain-containing protein [Paraglaciecola sp. L3A3]|uniref:GSCFA domain-containing protein n=1 Tax=Paraglaciecola sp. L3A3 TaxID=2686358 RepID=UPI00131D83AF|nr:GSCFA domain-containing protein [Paraglaciecola sp. L3A3]
MPHPYKKLADKAFWKRAVADGCHLNDLVSHSPLLSAGDSFASAGSCFAGNIIPYLESAGFNYVRKTVVPEGLKGIYEENFNYHTFSAAYGNIYTARHLLQLIQRALGLFQPNEDRWYIDHQVVDPFRPGLRFNASNDFEFDKLNAQYLESVISAFKEMDVFVFTLGLTEAWVSSIDGSVFPACPGTIAGKYDQDKHSFKNFSVAEISQDLIDAFSLLRTINPNLKVILTVSPVPLVATATAKHVVSATVYSKSVLRVAAEEVVNLLPFVFYFPAYEIVTGPQAPESFFEANRRDVSVEAIEAVMGALIANCELDAAVIKKPKPSVPPKPLPDNKNSSSRLVDLECEEAASDNDI